MTTLKQVKEAIHDRRYSVGRLRTLLSQLMADNGASDALKEEGAAIVNSLIEALIDRDLGLHRF